METKFIHFGCWNNLNTKKGKDIGDLRNVMRSLQSFVNIPENKPNFIIVAGDNYYPDKTKVEVTQEDGSTTNKKKNIIYDEKLIEGISLLPRDIEIDMIFGNHDLETNLLPPSKQKLYLENDSTVEQSDCHILTTELSATTKSKIPNMDYVFFKERFVEESRTLILMIDTTLYTVDSKENFPCYNVYFQNEIGHTFENIEQIRKYQFDKIMESIAKPMKNLILVGHHPMISYKKKENKGVVSKTELSENILTVFSDTLMTILDRLKNEEVNYYYLCADLHLYQQGTIMVELEGSDVQINQYIVGTGGTKLDDEIPADFVPSLVFPPPIKNYVVHENIRNHGFLTCLLPATPDADITFTFIPVAPVAGGKNRKTKKVKKKTKQRKSKKRRRTN